MEILLYSTDHCALCDEAFDLLIAIPELAGRPLRVIDVASDDVLLERYGERLPVLAVTTAAETLDWPFDRKSVLRWLADIK